MSNNQLSKWTAIFTNIAIVLGLVFVGLEFRANTRSDEAERIDSFMSGWSDVYTSLLQGDKLSEIYYRGFADPESLTDEEISIFMVYLHLSSGNFERIYRAHNLGLIPEETWAYHRAGIGYTPFISPIVSDTIICATVKQTHEGNRA